MTPDELVEKWRALAAPTRDYLRAASTGVPGFWIATDGESRPHLLIEVPHGTDTALTFRGLSATVRELTPEGAGEGTYLDLCFSAGPSLSLGLLGAELHRGLGGVVVNRRPAVASSILRAWRWFWSVDPDALGQHEAVGLLGEMWFLLIWTDCDPGWIDGWSGGDGAERDFIRGNHEVEVKTTSTTGPVTHRITSLDQLRTDATVSLGLLSIVMRRDAMSRNTLSGVIAALESSMVATPDRLDCFRRRLAKRGYSPDSGSASLGYRLVSQTMYVVDQEFPRLNLDKALLPPAVAEVSYDLVMAACADWAIATDPDVWDGLSAPPAR